MPWAELCDWLNLADETCENALYDVAAFRDNCHRDLGREREPEATTLLKFRHFLEEHKIGAASHRSSRTIDPIEENGNPDFAVFLLPANRDSRSSIALCGQLFSVSLTVLAWPALIGSAV